MKHKLINTDNDEYRGAEPDTLVQDFYHNKQNRADKRQQKFLRKKNKKYDEDEDYYF